MGKTDKELTADIVNVFIQSWNAKSSTQGIQSSHLPEIIQTVYDAISKLPNDDK